MWNESDLNPDRVYDEESFKRFVRALITDRELASSEEYGPNAVQGNTARGWQNRTIEGYLGSALAWVDDTQFGRSQGLPEDAPVWRRMALFLYLGKIYE